MESRIENRERDGSIIFFLARIQEKRDLGKLENVKRRILFLYNCRGHIITPSVHPELDEINMEVRFHPKHSMDKFKYQSENYVVVGAYIGYEVH